MIRTLNEEMSASSAGENGSTTVMASLVKALDALNSDDTHTTGPKGFSLVETFWKYLRE